jgi:16S rRNA (guanine527-N7)-methyltransferase
MDNHIRLLTRYFPDLNDLQIKQLEFLFPLYDEWNKKINVISRKDIEALYERHVLHSMAIGKVIRFKENTRILDVGTGGGFPGIPLAILFPEASFTLSDSIGKKIKVVNEISSALGLRNISTFHGRAETVREKFHFVVSRAVTTFPEFHSWVRNLFLKESFNTLSNGILYLKGGDLSEELKDFKNARIFSLKDLFETKKIVYLPVKG